MACKSIEEFKAVMQGGGVRPTMFQVEMKFPSDVVPDPNLALNEGIFLIKAASLPASSIGRGEIPFRGRKLKVSGDRVFEDWSVTVINETSFGIRKAFEEWSEKIQGYNYACGATELDSYFGSAIVRQLDRDGSQLRAYQFNGIWPMTVDAIELDFESVDTVENYGVTFAVQYFSAIDQGDPFVSAVPTSSTSNLAAITT